MKQLPLNIVPGATAPKYDTGYEATVERVTITEQGTTSKLPIVDVIGRDPDGQQVVMVLTGRQLCWIAAAIRGVNKRNHGTAEP